jgi:UDP-galactopyranose mutase|tara:strand:- start:1043 stop:2182 length:1140 start_codon:yes stop_codon:yes gene_type:complete
MKKINTDFLIVGSGLYGSVLAERISNNLKKKVLILEKRNHVGGNCFTEIDKETGIEYHKYGTHIFHTSIRAAWNYLKDFTEFNNYRHQVLTNHKKKIYQMPINLETINSFFKKSFSPSMAKKFIENKSMKYKKNAYENFEDKAKSQIGNELYSAFIKNYTRKQWNRNPKNLPASIFSRLPIRFNYNEDYYNQTQWQGIPLNGYTQIFKNILDNKLIKVLLNKKYDLKNPIQVKYLTIYTGPLDRLFNFRYGKLEWRSLKFRKQIISSSDFQGSSVINYPDLKNKFIRIHEPKHLHPERQVFKSNRTLIMKEFPVTNNEEPYYPINDSKNRDIQKKYKRYAKSIKNFTFGGRLADYAYYDMDMTISAAMKKFNFIKKILK